MPPYSTEKSILEGELEINALFDYVENNAEDFDAYQMEMGIKERLNKIGLAALKAYFAHKGTGDVGNTLQLEDGTLLTKESQLRERILFSSFGKLKIPRTYYRVKGKPGIMPLDAQANLPNRSYSYLLQEYMDLLNIKDPFGQSSEILEKFLGQKIYPNRFEAVGRSSCTSFDQYYEGKKLPEPQSEGAIIVAGFDGKGVPLIKSEAAAINARKGKGEKRQKKKEAIVGVSYTVNEHVRSPEEVAKNLIFPEENKNHKKKINRPRAKNIRRFASLERSKEEVFHEIMNHSRDRDPENKKNLVIVMDGALCLWSILMIFMANFSFTGILDIIHVTEYLWKVANALFKEGSKFGKKWVHDNLLAILEGNVKEVIDKLSRMSKIKKLKKSQRDAIEECIRYFTNHQDWMKYDEYLKAGYPIGSGVVESSCGHTVKNRMEGTGRRWSTEGAEAILLLRSIYTSQDWEKYWQFHMELERSFNYHGAMVAIGLPDHFNELGIVEEDIEISALAA